jgi:anti-sigma factor RsiW
MATPIDDDTLQRYHDGDLSPLEARGVAARVAEDPAARKRLEELAWLSAGVRQAAEQLAASVRADALFAAIEAQLDRAEKPTRGERLRVLSSEWIAQKRSALIPMAATFAVAAAALIAVLRPPTPTAETIVLAKGSQVENVDFGTSTGTVFEVDNQGVAAAVVWISDEDEP